MKIDGFSDTAGFMDKTDPFVELELGKEKYKTKVMNNAGGKADFNEEFAFDKKEGDQTIRLKVYDSDTMSNDLLGSRDIDLDDSSTGNGWYNVVKGGKETGKVLLEFSYN